MKKLGPELKRMNAGMASGDDTSRLAHRIAEVHAMWKDAIEQLYKENAPYVLKHTNGVYIKKENDLKHLVVYMDDGSVRSDIHCQQHFILAWLQEVHGEKIDVFKTLPSRFDMKNRHPYENTTAGEGSSFERRKPSVPLSEQEEAMVETVASTVEDDRVRRALQKAMNADLTWKKNESE